MPFFRTILFLTGALLLPGAGLAVTLDLVSRDTTGSVGQADSGSVQGGLEMRSAAVLDDGTVFFLSLAPLTPTDTNFVTDYYRRTGAGTVTAVDLPTGFASDHCFWGSTDDAGAKLYTFRQLAEDPFQFDVQFGTLAAKSSLGIRSSIKTADFADGGGYAVYERDVSGLRHLFLHDLTSTPKTETQFTNGHNGDGRNPAISANGARIVFSSTGTTVVPADVNGVADVLLYERTTGAFALVSQRLNSLANADALTPDISADGQVICFTSADDSFVSGDTNARSDVFAYHAGTLQRCSVASDGTQANQDSGSPRLSADGRFVVFVSRAGNLVPGVGNGSSQVFLHDRAVGMVEALSLTAGSVPADADCFVPEISPGGRYVTFVSKATNLVTGANGTRYQVYRADRGPHFANHPPVASGISLAGAQGTTIRFSLTAPDADQDPVQFLLVTRPLPAHGTLKDVNGIALLQGQSYGTASFPWRFVPVDGSLFADSFTFQASDGKTASAVATAQIRMVDPDRGSITRISVATDGTQSTQDSYLGYPGLGISADGRFVVFCSQAVLDPLDHGGTLADIYLRQTVTGTTSLMSATVADNKKAYRCALSGDGRSLVYYTEDGNALILQDVASGARQTVVAVSSYLSNSGPGVSSDGSRVIYEKDSQVWRFDRGTGTTAKVSVNAQGQPADASCGDIALSADGNVVAFSSAAANLVAANPGGIRSVYLRLLASSQTVLISTTQTGQLVENALKPALSETGRFVMFLADDGALIGDGLGTVYVKNVGTGVLRQIAVDAANPAISADGRFVCYTKAGTNGKNQLYRADLAGDPAHPQLVSNAAGEEGDGACYRAVLSAMGRFVAFASNATNLVTGDSNGKCDVFLNDFGIPSNNLPVSTLTAVTTDEDAPLVDIPLTCTDPEDNDVQTEIVTGPVHAEQFVLSTLQTGQATVTFTYAPVANYSGQDSFTYRTADAEGWSAPVTVTITLRPVNDTPQWTGMPVLWRTDPGREFRLDLSRFVDDPDTRNSVPDVLRFSFIEGAPGVTLDGTVLVLSEAVTAGPAATRFRVGVTDQNSAVVAFGAELAIHARPPVEILFAKGWNLISFPMPSEPSDPARLLTGSWVTGSLPLYTGPLWDWDADAACYRIAETVEPGHAYWVRCPEAASVSLQVAWPAPVAAGVTLAPGWNLAGPVGFGEVATPTVVATGVPIPQQSIWWWNGTHYVNPPQNTMACGQGSWVWLSFATAQTVDIRLGPAE